MDTGVTLNPDQKRFLAHACAFIDTDPPPDELDKLLTLAVMLLPPSVAEMLAERAAKSRRSGADDGRPPGRLQ